MTITQALSNGLSGLGANARMAEVISANIANALTEGYGRRSVDLQARTLTGGVLVTGISRAADPILLTDRRDAGAALSRDDTGAAMLARLEQLFAGDGAPADLAGRLSALDQALISAAADPAAEGRLSTLLSRLTDLTSAFAAGERGIQALRTDADAAIAAQVNRLNGNLRTIDDLNDAIVRARMSGGDPSGLVDQRQVLIDDLAQMMEIRELPREDGRVTLYTRSGQMLLDRRPVQFGFDAAPAITADMTLAGGVLGGITLDGVPLSSSGFGRLTGGSLQSLFDLRDRILPDAQTGLDRQAADLMTRFESLATDPTRPPSAPGLLTDNGVAYNALNQTGLAGRLSVNASVDPAQGGALFRLRDGVGGTVPGPVGQAAQLDRWLAGLDSATSLAPGGAVAGAGGHAAAFATQLALARVDGDRALSFTTARHAALKDRELAQGVDSDQEMQRLLQIEQAYAANARVIQTVDDMMQRLLEM